MLSEFHLLTLTFQGYSSFVILQICSTFGSDEEVEIESLGSSFL